MDAIIGLIVPQPAGGLVLWVLPDDGRGMTRLRVPRAIAGAGLDLTMLPGERWELMVADDGETVTRATFRGEEVTR